MNILLEILNNRAIVAAITAWAIARGGTRLFKAARIYFLIGILIPAQALCLPIYLLWNSMGLINSRVGLIALYVSTGLSFGIFLQTNYMKTVPIDIEEAAKIDGCTEFKAFWRVVFPLLGPCTASLVVLNGLSIWNDFLMPYLALPSNQAKTITVAVYSFVGQYTARWDIVFAGTLISLVPALIIYVSLQKYFVKGIMSGAAKG